MRTVTKRELNQNTAEVLSRVTDGEPLVVTERGRPRWRVTVAHQAESMLERLEHEGRFTPAAASPTAWPQSPGGPPYTTAEADELLEAMRGDH